MDTLSQASPGGAGEQKESRYSRLERESRALQKMENSGNEAKKCLKTNDITFFNAANYARLGRRLEAI
jgi:hypothetical protein